MLLLVGGLLLGTWLLWSSLGDLDVALGRGRFSISVEQPPQARVGDTLSLNLVMENFEDRVIDGMLYVDLSGGLYDGLTPIQSQPPWLYAFDDDVQRRHKLSFELELVPGPNRYRLDFEAKASGAWDGELSYYRTTTRRPVGPPVSILVRVAH